jgi:Xaa-Pro aminopeptidase
MFEAASSHSMIRASAHIVPRASPSAFELKRRPGSTLRVPRADRQQNEYLPASEERLAWLTGFTGSAGAAVVLDDRAALFVDGRYTVQATLRSTAIFF